MNRAAEKREKCLRPLTRKNKGEKKKETKKEKNKKQERKNGQGDHDEERLRVGSGHPSSGSSVNSSESASGKKYVLRSRTTRGITAADASSPSSPSSRDSMSISNGGEGASSNESSCMETSGDSRVGSVITMGNSRSSGVEDSDYDAGKGEVEERDWEEYSVTSSDACRHADGTAADNEQENTGSDSDEDGSVNDRPEASTASSASPRGEASQRTPSRDGRDKIDNGGHGDDAACSNKQTTVEVLSKAQAQVRPEQTHESSKDVAFEGDKQQNYPGTTGPAPDEDELDMRTTAQNLAIPSESLFEQYIVVAINFDAFQRHPVTGFPVVGLRDIVSKFYAIIFNGLNMLGAHAVGLPYDPAEKDAATLACAADLPQDAADLITYAKDARYNRTSEKVVFHVRFLSSIPIAHLKRAYYPEIGDAGRLTMKLLKQYQVWYKIQQCAETRVAKIGWFLFSHPTDGLDNVRSQLRGLWKEKGIVFDDEQWQLSARRFSVASGGKKIETTALWIDCGISLIKQMSGACRMLTEESAKNFPLLWNLVFIADRDFMELRSEFRYASAAKQKDFIGSRFTYDVKGFDFNPYEDFPIRNEGTTSKQALRKDRNLASLILQRAVTTGRQGQSIPLFTKIQLPAARPGIWSFQGTRQTAGVAREWIDRKLLPLVKQLYTHGTNKRRPESMVGVGRVQGRRVIAVNDPTELYLQRAAAVVTPSKGGSKSAQGSKQPMKYTPKRGMASYAEVLAENHKFPPLSDKGMAPPHSITTTANLTSTVSPISKGPSIEEMQTKISRLVQTVEQLTKQQQVTQEKYERQRSADQEEFRQLLKASERRHQHSPMTDHDTPPPPSWLANLDEHLNRKLKEADNKWIERTQEITKHSQATVIDFTSAKLLEMNSKLDAVTAQIGQLPGILQEMRQFMASYSTHRTSPTGKRVRRNESDSPGSTLECQLRLRGDDMDTHHKIYHDNGDPSSSLQNE